MKKAEKEQQKKESIKSLKNNYKIKPNSTIIVNQTNCSRSGMARRLELYVIDKEENRLNRITWDVANILDWPINDKGLLVTGCGMDMHFHTVYTLSHELFGIENEKYTGNAGTCMEWQSI